MSKTWSGKRYHTLNHFLREKFGEKVFKISLDAGFTCPNRDGRVSSGGCIFCSPRGSGDFAGTSQNIVEQFHEVRGMMNKKWKSGRYIAYFQAYTNTYAEADVLREKYYSVLNLEDVAGIAIATRPDCLPADVLDLLAEISSRTYLWVELGLQTMHERTARLINRGYGLDTYIASVKELKKRNIEVVTHQILGLPGENKRDMIQTVDFISNTGTQGIKLHLLHLLKDTRLAEMYRQGEFQLMSMEDYIEVVVDCIERIPENMVIHRITGDGPRDALIAPKWSLKKFEVINAIEHLMMDRDTWQGKKYEPNNDIMNIFV
ncbi:MAG TPA: TIGR01212 family radical SAM protein [Bacillota bacterium]|nr:TIGR01212 family radical SAM protein [Clostridiaceae bacterium]HNR03886.1 TIGR01212 family radical SAM protein [Bacillota bacterium]HNT03488.1 TIGR01212 family radical SAM protein [Bacillota bacterium]HPA54333.1 TIGR01212 family radical SAM protein [Bacillota bacterium]HPX68659.1 TIGR01212 family radical SAM protein [Bacillota bacterium]